MAIGDSARRKLQKLMQAIAKRDFASAAEILRAVRGRPGAEAPAPQRPLTLEEVCAGAEVSVPGSGGRGKFYLIRSTLKQADPQRVEFAGRLYAVLSGAGQRFDELSASAELCRLADGGPEDLLFLDIETCGLRGMAIFLIGLMYLRDRQIVFEQLLSRDYAEEAAMLQGFIDRLPRARAIVTFNGKAFDMNLIRERCAFHGLSVPPRHPAHLDLLHESRRRWRRRLPDCRLQTLEHYLCGRHRVADIPGHAIPDAYHRFVGTRDARRIGDILQHNLLDMLTMGELLCLFLTGSDPAESWAP